MLAREGRSRALDGTRRSSPNPFLRELLVCRVKGREKRHNSLPEIRVKPDSFDLTRKARLQRLGRVIEDSRLDRPVLGHGGGKVAPLELVKMIKKNTRIISHCTVLSECF